MCLACKIPNIAMHLMDYCLLFCGNQNQDNIVADSHDRNPTEFVVHLNKVAIHPTDVIRYICDLFLKF